MEVSVSLAAVSVAGTTIFPKNEVELKLQYPTHWAASNGSVPCDHSLWSLRIQIRSKPAAALCPKNSWPLVLATTQRL
jgi:hypothetical protein